MEKRKCTYVNGRCSKCGKPRGWRVSTWNRVKGYAPCAGKRETK